MNVTCPKCDSDLVRHAKTRGFAERLGILIGRFPLRCNACDHRFVQRLARVTNVFFARCPRCYRMDLATWESRYYNPASGVRILLAVGAKRLRCERCRTNFASFRRVKQKYTRRRTRPAEQVTASAE